MTTTSLRNASIPAVMALCTAILAAGENDRRWTDSPFELAHRCAQVEFQLVQRRSENGKSAIVLNALVGVSDDDNTSLFFSAESLPLFRVGNGLSVWYSLSDDQITVLRQTHVHLRFLAGLGHGALALDVGPARGTGLKNRAALLAWLKGFAALAEQQRPGEVQFTVAEGPYRGWKCTVSTSGAPHWLVDDWPLSNLTLWSPDGDSLELRGITADPVHGCLRPMGIELAHRNINFRKFQTFTERFGAGEDLQLEKRTQQKFTASSTTDEMLRIVFSPARECSLAAQAVKLLFPNNLPAAIATRPETRALVEAERKRSIDNVVDSLFFSFARNSGYPLFPSNGEAYQSYFAVSTPVVIGSRLQLLLGDELCERLKNKLIEELATGQLTVDRCRRLCLAVLISGLFLGDADRKAAISAIKKNGAPELVPWTVLIAAGSVPSASDLNALRTITSQPDAGIWERCLCWSALIRANDTRELPTAFFAYQELNAVWRDRKARSESFQECWFATRQLTSALATIPEGRKELCRILNESADLETRWMLVNHLAWAVKASGGLSKEETEQLKNIVNQTLEQRGGRTYEAVTLRCCVLGDLQGACDDSLKWLKGGDDNAWAAGFAVIMDGSENSALPLMNYMSEKRWAAATSTAMTTIVWPTYIARLANKPEWELHASAAIDDCWKKTVGCPESRWKALGSLGRNLSIQGNQKARQLVFEQTRKELVPGMWKDICRGLPVLEALADQTVADIPVEHRGDLSLFAARAKIDPNSPATLWWEKNADDVLRQINEFRFDSQ